MHALFIHTLNFSLGNVLVCVYFATVSARDSVTAYC